MKTSLSHIILILSGLVISSSLDARELRLADCPPDVRKAIRKEARGGRIDEIRQRGRTRFLAEIDFKGDRDLKLRLTRKGTVVFSERDIRFRQLPDAVRLALQDTLHTGERIDDIEEVLRRKRTVFRIEIDRPGDRNRELILSREGVILKRRNVD